MTTTFTPISSLIGGAMIGLAAFLLLALNGRIAGISGILGGLLDAERKELGWRLTFLAGLLLGPLAVGLVVPQAVPPLRFEGSLGLALLAGLLVGFGTRLGGGCTSGHGVCGIARLSPRSLVATAIFMSVAIVTVFISRHLL